jgi:hypothetical protein
LLGCTQHTDSTETELETNVTTAYNNVAHSFIAKSCHCPDGSSIGPERIELLYKIGTHLAKAQEEMEKVFRLLDELTTVPHEPVKNTAPKIVDDSMQPGPTIIPRTIPWRKRDFKQLNRNVVH